MVSFKFWSTESTEKGLHFQVCGDTSTSRRLHHYRQYFGGKYAQGAAPGSESTVFEITQNLWKQTLAFLRSFRSFPFLHNRLYTLHAHLNWNSPLSSNYSLLVFLWVQLCFWILNAILHKWSISSSCDSLVPVLFWSTSIVLTLFCSPAVTTVFCPKNWKA